MGCPNSNVVIIAFSCRVIKEPAAPVDSSVEAWIQQRALRSGGNVSSPDTMLFSPRRRVGNRTVPTSAFAGGSLFSCVATHCRSVFSVRGLLRKNPALSPVLLARVPGEYSQEEPVSNKTVGDHLGIWKSRTTEKLPKNSQVRQKRAVEA